MMRTVHSPILFGEYLKMLSYLVKNNMTIFSYKKLFLLTGFLLFVESASPSQDQLNTVFDTGDSGSDMSLSDGGEAGVGALRQALNNDWPDTVEALDRLLAAVDGYAEAAEEHYEHEPACFFCSEKPVEDTVMFGCGQVMHQACLYNHMENGGVIVQANQLYVSCVCQKKTEVRLETLIQLGWLKYIELLAEKQFEYLEIGINEVPDYSSQLPILHQAVRAGHQHVISWALEQAADVNLLDQHGNTPLRYAVEGLESRGYDDAVIKQLLAAGGRPDIPCGDGLSPYDRALAKYGFEVVSAWASELAYVPDAHVPAPY
jgi:hypothetical protein